MRAPARFALSALSLSFTASGLFASAAYNPNDTSCQTVFNATTTTVDSVDAYNCLISTPFNQTIATQLLGYWKGTLKFQSTLAYLLDPPPSYQQNSVDLLGGLDLIQTQVDQGVFDNQFAFESAVQGLIYAAHDSHVDLTGLASAVFTFSSPYSIVAVSADGIAIPKVYLVDDLNGANNDSSVAYSAVKTINGQVASDYLTVFGSRNSPGSIEPHGDWNQLMYAPAGDVQGIPSSFLYTIFYPGESITLEFENGTAVGPTPFQATYVYTDDLPIINNGMDFYQWYVLGEDTTSDQAAANATQSNSTSSTTADADAGPTATDTTSPATDSSSPTTTASDSSPTDDGSDGSDDSDEGSVIGWGGAYPDPDVAEPNLGYGGYVTGYFLNDTKVGVLSIPTFLLTSQGSDTFSDTIAEFLQRSKQAGMKKILIDLQQNYGGEQLLATDAFKQFFPQIDPFSGMRTRSFDMADVLGNTFTQFLLNNGSQVNETTLDNLLGDPWAVSSELDANTNTNFTSWPEYFGPHPDRNDGFSTVYRYNLSSALFDEATTGIVISGYANRSSLSPQPYDANDIAILTDAACASTCDLFVEMMHHEGAVRTVVVGGLPQYGPMQARGGTRGAMVYTDSELDADMEVAAEFNASVAPILPDRSEDVFDQTTLSFNLADQIRRGEYFPLQFTYEAANCRIFYTKDTFNNYTNLWQYAASAIFFNASTCVPRSAEHNDTLRTNPWGPSAEQKTSWAETNPAWVPLNNSLDTTALLAQDLYGPNLHLDWPSKNAAVDQPCGPGHSSCPGTQYQCLKTVSCRNGQLQTPQLQCKLACGGNLPGCPRPYTCNQRELKCQNGKCSGTGFCEKAASVTDKQCQNLAAAKGSAPPVTTIAPAQPYVVDYNNKKH